MSIKQLFGTTYRYSLSFVILVAIIILLKKSILSALCLTPAFILALPLLDKFVEEKIPFLKKLTFKILFGILFFALAIGTYPNIMDDSNTTTNTTNANTSHTGKVTYDANGNEISRDNTVTSESKTIVGLKPSSIYLAFEQIGFKTEKNIDAEGGIYTSKATIKGIDYYVETYSNSENDVTSVTLTATRTNPQYNKVTDMKQFLKNGCSIPYDGADQEKISKFIDDNYYNNKANIVISGVKFTIYTPTEFVRMMEIEKVNKIQSEIQLDNSEFWKNYSPDVKTRIHKLIENKDCKGLQEEFNLADKNNQAQMNRTGRNNAELMDFIDNNMRELGCYNK